MSGTPLLLDNVTLIDGLGHKSRANTRILIRNGRVTAVGSAEEVGVPDGARVEDLSGRWVIPGLIDMHCHIGDNSAPYFVAAGVTTVRNTAGFYRFLQDLRRAPAHLPVPRLITAGRIIDGDPALWGPTGPGNLATNDPQLARAEVRRQVEVEGVDLVKVYSRLLPEVMRAVAEEAGALGVEVSCDLGYHKQVDILQAARMGVRWNEHATGFTQALYPEFIFKWHQSNWEAIPWEAFESPQLDRLCEEVAALGMILCPTMTLWEQAGRLPDPWWPEHPAANAMKQNEELVKHFSSFPAANAVGAYRYSLINQAVVRAYRRAGGTVVAGTDAPALSWNGYGVTLHRELQLLVQNGWSPMEALKAATSVAAQALGRKDLGRVAPGAAADLVILKGDPLQDIANTLLTDRVVKGGAVYTPEEVLAAMPDGAAVMAKYQRLVAEFMAENPAG